MKAWSVLLISMMFLPISAFGGVSATAFASYLTDDFSETTTSQNLTQIYGGSFMTALDSKDSIFVGWSYTSLLASSVSGSTTNTFSATDMGPVLSWWFGKNKAFNITAAYNVISTATYDSTGSSTKQWGGTSYYLAAGAELELLKGLQLGARMIYYGTSYNDQKIGSAASTVSYGRTFLVPILTISYRK